MTPDNRHSFDASSIFKCAIEDGTVQPLAVTSCGNAIGTRKSNEALRLTGSVSHKPLS